MKNLFKTALVCVLSAMTFVACEKGGNEGAANNGNGDGGNTETTFDIEVSQIKTTSAYISVTPSNNRTTYYFDVMPEEDYVDLDGNVGAFFEELLGYYTQLYPSLDVSLFVQQLVSVGPAGDAVTRLTPGSTYYAYAVAVDERGKALSYSAVPFTTLEGGNPATCTFDIAVRGVYSTEVEFTITPSDESVAYWYAVTSVNGYPGDVALQNEVKQTLESYAAENNKTIEEVAKGVVYRGTVEDYWFELEADTSYYIYAYAMNEKGEAVGPLYKKQFTTTLYDISDAEVSVTYRIFDAEELRGADYKGYACFQYEVTPSASATYWLVMLAGGDFTNTTTYPDDATINAMLEGSNGFNKLVAHYYVPWDTTATLLSFAADANMQYGPLTRQLVTVTKDACEPISLYREPITAELPLATATAKKALRGVGNVVEHKMASLTKVKRNLQF